MDRTSFENVGDWSLTLAGLAGLQFPCLVSAASPTSPLAKFKSLGFPFNMSAGTLNKHFSFSPENLLQGRYHTLVTNLFNHHGKVNFCLNQNDDLLDRVFLFCSSGASCEAYKNLMFCFRPNLEVVWKKLKKYVKLKL